MRERSAYLIVIVLMIVASVACASPLATTTPIGTPIPETSTSTSNPSSGSTESGLEALDDPGFNLLVIVEGEVSIKRRGWETFYPVPFGTVLERGDLIRTADATRTVILCDDLSTWAAPAGEISGLSGVCPPPAEEADRWLLRGSTFVGSTRGGMDPLLPYIISPRATRLLDPRPILRWNDTSAESYTVRVEGGGLEWETGVSEAEVEYDGPDLKPGVVYLLTVTADDGRSSQDEGIPGLGFSLLDEEVAALVRSAEERINNLGLGHDPTMFALSQLYAGYDLTGEAIELLESLVEAGSAEPAVYMALGNLYFRAQLLLLAEGAYLEAEHLAGSASVVEMQADAQAGLGGVLAARGSDAAAVRWFTQALANYETLGDTRNADDIQAEIDALTP